MKIVSERKPQATMASKTSSRKDSSAPDNGDTATLLSEFVADLARRRAAIAGSAYLDPPRNSGQRRTASKRALLAAIAETGAKW